MSVKSFADFAIDINGECVSDIIQIIPKCNKVSQNPVILIGFAERDYQIFEALKNAKFCLVDNKGKKIKLEVLQLNKGFHSIAQIFLKSKKKLKRGKIVSIEINGLSLENEKHKKFLKKVQSKKWEISFKKDKTSPYFQSDLKFNYENYLTSSASGHGVRGNVSFHDDNEYTFEHKGGVKNQIVLEVVDENGNSYLTSTHGDLFWISDGMCGAAFELKQDAEYTFDIRLVDLSGNKSKEVKRIQFKTGNGSLH